MSSSPEGHQCEGASTRALTALPPTLAIFDKFKPAPSVNGKHSDSEESFHLHLEDDDTEDHSSGDANKDVHNEETEADILNKFEVTHDGLTDVDPQVEERILNDEVDQSSTRITLKTVIRISSHDDDSYDNKSEGEFKSLYEDEVQPDSTSEQTDLVQETNVFENAMGMDNDEDASEQMEGVNVKLEKGVPAENGMLIESNSCDIKVPEIHIKAESDDGGSESSQAAQKYKRINGCSSLSSEKLGEVVNDDSNNFACKPKSKNIQTTDTAANDSTSDKSNVKAAQEINELKTDETLSESDKTVSELEAEINMAACSNNSDGKLTSESPSSSNNDLLLKLLEEVHDPEKDIKEEPQSNDRTEDESDLLDVTMIRETEEDDACAMADAMMDIETTTSEKSDEDERMEIEQETSDNDNIDMGFEQMDEGSHKDDNVSSSRSEQASDKLVKISDNASAIKEPPDKSDKKGKIRDEAVIDDATTTKKDEDKSMVDDREKSDKEKFVDKSDKIVLVNNNQKTDKLGNKPEEKKNMTAKVVIKKIACGKVVKETNKNIPEDKSSLNKRSHTSPEIALLAPKKAKILTAKPTPTASIADKTPPKLAVLTDFAKFMQCRQLTAKLTRSDLEQFCIQKICETLMLKSSEGQLNEQVATLEKTIRTLRRDVSHLLKQSKDLEIVNSKLMTELKQPSGAKRPLLPLRITRSVGLQVRRVVENDPRQNVNKTLVTVGTNTIPQKQLTSSTVKVSAKPAPPINTSAVEVCTDTRSSSAVKQVLQDSSPASTTVSGLSSRDKAQTHRSSPAAFAHGGATTPARKPAPVRKPVEAPARKPVEAPARKSAEAPVRKPVEAPARKSAEAPVRKPVETPARKSVETPARKSVEAPARKSVEAPARKPAEAPARKSVDAPAKKPVEAPARGSVVDLTDEDDRLAQQAKSTANNKLKTVTRTNSQGSSIPGNKTTAATNKNSTPPVKTVIQKQPTFKTVPQTCKQNSLPQGIRLAQAIKTTTSDNRSPHMVYVVPTSVTNALTGQQKVAFVNFQPTIPTQTHSPQPSNTKASPGLPVKPGLAVRQQKHPAPLPADRVALLDPKLKPPLPKPLLSVRRTDTGIILQWKMPYNLDQFESIASYQLFAYQQTSAPPSTKMWRKVGDVKALALPMACTLTHFADNNKYFFAVRSVDVHKRVGAFSEPEEISL